jgi:hypothetical protein
MLTLFYSLTGSLVWILEDLTKNILMLHVCTHTLPAHFTAVPSSRMYMMYQAIHVHKLLHYPSTTLVVIISPILSYTQPPEMAKPSSRTSIFVDACMDVFLQDICFYLCEDISLGQKDRSKSILISLQLITLQVKRTAWPFNEWA